jgi:hypothetical protein
VATVFIEITSFFWPLCNNKHLFPNLITLAAPFIVLAKSTEKQ